MFEKAEKIICLGEDQCCPYRAGAKLKITNKTIEIVDSFGTKMLYRKEILNELRDFIKKYKILPNELNQTLSLNSIEYNTLIDSIQNL